METEDENEEWESEELSDQPRAPMYEKKDKEESSIPNFKESRFAAAVPMYEAYERVAVPMYPVKTPKIGPEVNDWSQSNLDTINKWQNDIQKSSFIYGQLLERKEFYLQLILILTLIFGGIITILSGVSAAVSLLDVDPTWATFSFSVIVTVLGSTITGLNGIPKIFNWDEDVKILIKIIDKLDDLWFVFETEMNIDPEDRENGKAFVKRMNGEYMSLMQMCPHVRLSDYVRGNKSYQERLSKNLIWQKTFNQNKN